MSLVSPGSPDLDEFKNLRQERAAAEQAEIKKNGGSVPGLKGISRADKARTNINSSRGGARTQRATNRSKKVNSEVEVQTEDVAAITFGREPINIEINQMKDEPISPHFGHSEYQRLQMGSAESLFSKRKPSGTLYTKPAFKFIKARKSYDESGASALFIRNSGKIKRQKKKSG